MDLIMIDIFLKAFLLCFLLYLFARHEADFSFSKVTIVIAFIVLGTFFIDLILMKYIGPFTMVPAAGFFFYMIIEYCWVSWKKAFLITVIFFAIHFLLTILAGMLLVAIFHTDVQTESLTEKHNNEMMEGINVARDILGVPSTNTLPIQQEKVTQPSENVPAQQPINKKHATSKRDLKYSGFMTDANGKKVALVNGQSIAEGEVIKVKYKGTTYKWRLVKINRFGPEWEAVVQ